MGKFIKEDSFLNSHAASFHDMLESRYTRAMDKPPTYVTYYNICNTNSLSDIGFADVERSLGPNSPLRFNQVKTLPIYGIEDIVLDLDDGDEGLTTGFEGEGILLPNTIKPLPNDVFVIDYLPIDVLFVVNEIKYDTLKNDNYYKIFFSIRRIDSGDQKKLLEPQVVKKFTCNVMNVGTSKNSILEDDVVDKIEELKKYRDNIKEIYDTIYYSKKYNSFIFNGISQINENMNFANPVYDRALSHFIQNNRLYSDETEVITRYVANEDNDRSMLLEYERSFFRIIERRSIVGLTPEILFTLHSMPVLGSTFSYYRSSFNFIRLTVPGGGFKYKYIDPELLTCILTNRLTKNNLYNLIIKYINKSVTSIYDIDLKFIEEFNLRQYTFENYILIPVIIFIINSYINEFSI